MASSREKDVEEHIITLLCNHVEFESKDELIEVAWKTPGHHHDMETIVNAVESMIQCQHITVHDDRTVTLGTLTDEFTETIDEIIQEMPEYLRRNNITVNVEFKEFDVLEDPIRKWIEYHPSLLSWCLTRYYYLIKHPAMTDESKRPAILERSAMLGTLSHQLLQAYIMERLGGHIEKELSSEFFPGWMLAGHVDYISEDFTKILEIKTVKNSSALKYVPYPEHVLQASAYRLLMVSDRLLRGKVTEDLDVYLLYVTRDTLQHKIVKIPRPRVIEGSMDIEDRGSILYYALNKLEIPPNPHVKEEKLKSFLCQSCEFLQICEKTPVKKEGGQESVQPCKTPCSL